MKHLLNSKVLFIVDGSLFPEKSYLIAATWYTLVSGKVVARGDFILSVTKEYRYLYSAEFYRALSIKISINTLLLLYPHPSISFELPIGSDY